MRYIWAFILIFSAINPAKADCWAISNNDVQKMCLAKTKNDTTYCWQIKDNDRAKILSGNNQEGKVILLAD